MYLSLFPHPVVFATHLSTHGMYVYMYACMHYVLHPRKVKFQQGSYIPNKQILGRHLKLNPTFLVTSFVINNPITLCYTLCVITASFSNPDMQNNAAGVTWKFRQTQMQSHGDNTIYIMFRPIYIYICHCNTLCIYSKWFISPQYQLAYLLTSK